MATTIPQPCSPEQAISIQIAELVAERRTATGAFAQSITAEIRLLQTDLRNAVRS